MSADVNTLPRFVSRTRPLDVEEVVNLDTFVTVALTAVVNDVVVVTVLVVVVTLVVDKLDVVLASVSVDVLLMVVTLVLVCGSNEVEGVGDVTS